MGHKRRTVRILAMILSLLLCAAAGSAFAVSGTCSSEHDYEVTIVKRATSDKEGLRRYECRACGNIVEEAIPATGHHWGAWKVKLAATSEASGLSYRVCKNDPDHIQYKAISKLEETSSEKLPSIRKMSEESTFATVALPSQTEEPALEEEPEEPAEEPEETAEPAKPAQKPAPGKSVGRETVAKDIADEIVPMGAADALIIGANGVAAIYFLILLLPLFRVWLWIGKKRREAEEQQ